MASSTIIPKPNAEGYYSSFLRSKQEQLLIDSIIDATSRLSAVEPTNAGELLFRIWDEAKSFSGMGMPTRPPYLSTLDQCNVHIQRHPDLVPLLAAVHEKKAYAWLCEHSTYYYPSEVRLIDTAH
jgi:hypothetical protein